MSLLMYRARVNYETRVCGINGIITGTGFFAAVISHLAPNIAAASHSDPHSVFTMNKTVVYTYI